MKVRKAVEKDLGTLERIFDKARLFMKESGNPAQWIDGYPAPDRIMADIKNGDCYCVVDDTGHVVGTFAFIVGEDPNYKEIRNGSWLNDRPYATIHRLAYKNTVFRFAVLSVWQTVPNDLLFRKKFGVSVVDNPLGRDVVPSKISSSHFVL